MKHYISVWRPGLFLEPVDFGAYVKNDYLSWQQQKTRLLVGINTSFRVLKHSYGFINSILLIVMIRPLKEPTVDLIVKVKNLFKKLKK